MLLEDKAALIVSVITIVLNLIQQEVANINLTPAETSALLALALILEAVLGDIQSVPTPPPAPPAA